MGGKWGICDIMLINCENKLSVATQTEDMKEIMQEMFLNDDMLYIADNGGVMGLQYILEEKNTAVSESTGKLANKEEAMISAIFGSAVLVIGGVIVCIKKKIY